MSATTYVVALSRFGFKEGMCLFPRLFWGCYNSAMQPVIVANWKNHPASLKEAKSLFEATKKALEKAKGLSFIIAPPALYLPTLVASYRGKRIRFAAQSALADDTVAQTGECTLAQVSDAGAFYVLVGHAERRARSETSESIRRTVASALARHMTPILCIGETTRDDSGEHFITLREQLRSGLSEVPAGRTNRVLIAYEPVWAIGNTTPMNPRDMHEMAIFIRKTLYDMFGKSGLTQPILYGGAIDERSAGQMLGLGDVQGLLVGHASTEASSVIRLIDSLSKFK